MENICANNYEEFENLVDASRVAFGSQFSRKINGLLKESESWQEYQARKEEQAAIERMEELSPDVKRMREIVPEIEGETGIIDESVIRNLLDVLQKLEDVDAEKIETFQYKTPQPRVNKCPAEKQHFADSIYKNFCREKFKSLLMLAEYLQNNYPGIEITWFEHAHNLEKDENGRIRTLSIIRSYNCFEQYKVRQKVLVMAGAFWLWFIGFVLAGSGEMWLRY